MFSLKYFELYKKYGGNEDGFLRCATSEERLLLNYSCWILLDEFVQDLIIVKRGLASGSFIKSLDERLGESCDDEATIHALMIMVDQFI